VDTAKANALRLPWRALRHGIASNINTVVHLAQREDGSRYVAEAIRVEGYDAESDSFRTRELSDDQPVST
jgi:Flp pilus assembly CpaF family ATPase